MSIATTLISLSSWHAATVPPNTMPSHESRVFPRQVAGHEAALGTRNELVIFEMVASKNWRRRSRDRAQTRSRAAWCHAPPHPRGDANDGLVAKMANTTVVADKAYIGGVDRAMTPGFALT